MKIQCPTCKATYQVNFPNLTEKGVAVECAKCHKKFLVKPEATTPTPSPKAEQAEKAFTAPPLVQKEDKPEANVAQPPVESPVPAGSDDSFDNFLDDLIQKETQTPEKKSATVAQDAGLDNLMDNIMGGDLFQEAVPDEQPANKSTGSPENTSAQDAGLDNFMDDIMGGDLFQDAVTETPSVDSKGATVSAPSENIDDLFDIIGGDSKVAADTMNDTAMDAIWDQAVAEGGSVKAESTEDDILAQVFADQENLNKKTEGSAANTEVAATAVMETGTANETEDPWAQAFADQEKTEAAAAVAAPAAEGASEEDPWAQAFADQAKTEAAAAAAAPAAEGASDEDLWAQAFADQEKTEAAATTGSAPAAEGGSDEDLWAKAFADDEKGGEPAKNEASAVAAEEREEPAATTPGVEDELGEAKRELESTLGDEEVGAADYDLEETEKPSGSGKKKFLGFISLPSTKTGKWVLTGSLVALLVAAGGGYFAYKTLLPEELAEMIESKMPGEKTKAKKEAVAKSEQPETAEKSEEAKPVAEKDGKKPESAKTAKEPEKTKDSKEPEKVKDAKGSEKAKDAKEPAKAETAAPEKSDDKKEPEAAAPPQERTPVTLSTIMPVAFNAHEIRVLSFTMEVELSNEETSKIVQNALPLFEKITVATVEEFLQKKFYNDILYVREKLQKKMEVAFNNKIKGGKTNKVKRIKFKEFTIQ